MKKKLLMSFVFYALSVNACDLHDHDHNHDSEVSKDVSEASNTFMFTAEEDGCTEVAANSEFDEADEKVEHDSGDIAKSDEIQLAKLFEVDGDEDSTEFDSAEFDAALEEMMTPEVQAQMEQVFSSEEFQQEFAKFLESPEMQAQMAEALLSEENADLAVAAA